MPFKNKTVRARMLSHTYCRDFQKKGKRKPTCHFPSSVYSLPSLGVFTFRIVLNRTWSLVGADLGQLVSTYKRAVCVCLSACLSVFFLSATRHLSTLRRWLRVLREQPSRRARPRARAARRASACTALARARARMPYNFSTKKSLRWSIPFKNN